MSYTNQREVDEILTKVKEIVPDLLKYECILEENAVKSIKMRLIMRGNISKIAKLVNLGFEKEKIEKDYIEQFPVFYQPLRYDFKDEN